MEKYFLREADLRKLKAINFMFHRIARVPLFDLENPEDVANVLHEALSYYEKYLNEIDYFMNVFRQDFDYSYIELEKASNHVAILEKMIYQKGEFSALLCKESVECSK